MSKILKIIDTKKKKRSKSSESSESSDSSDSSLSSLSSLSSSSSSSTSSDLSDYDSSSSLEIVVNPKKLRDQLLKELEASRKAAAAKGAPTYADGTKQKLDKNGRIRSEGIVRLERVMKQRRILKAQVMRNMERHLQRAHVRKAYEFFSRDIPPENDLGSDLTRKKVRVSADENCLSVTIFRRSPVPY